MIVGRGKLPQLFFSPVVICHTGLFVEASISARPIEKYWVRTKRALWHKI